MSNEQLTPPTDLLREVLDALECRERDDAHYCPNCDRSLYDITQKVRAAVTKSERCEHGTIIIPPAVCKQCRDAVETSAALCDFCGAPMPLGGRRECCEHGIQADINHELDR